MKESSMVSIRSLCAKLRQRAKIKIRAKTEIPYGEDLKTIGGLRGYNGYKCFVGLFVSDDQYDPKLEGLSVDKLFSIGVFGKIPKERLPLLRRAQIIHDFVPTTHWDSALDALEKDSFWQAKFLAKESKTQSVEAQFLRNVARGKREENTTTKEPRRTLCADI